MADGSAPITQGQLSVGDLCTMFEDAEEATQTSRKDAERDRDYYDNKQLTAAEKDVLRKRGQPEVIINRIKRKVDFLVGLEKQQRVNPKALPRTPSHDDDADGATQALIYVADEENYDSKRSQVWRNMLVEGAGGMAVRVEPSKYNNQQAMATTAMTPTVSYDVKLVRIAWDRMFADPHSSEPDFSDAAYKGVVVWMDFDDAVAKYPDGKDALDTTMASGGSLSDTYDDKPKWRLWADKKRKRVRIVQMWLKRDDEWYFAEFTKGGILKAGPSPYKTDKGESDCELIFQSAYVNRENERYGVVREMISPQDEINKRRSKSLHLLNTAQIVTEEGMFTDIEKLRKEAVRPDGVIVLPPGGSEKFRFETRTDLAAAQMQLLQEAKNEIDLMGPNAAMQGDQPDSTASGKAIIASQQGGMIEMGDLLDGLRHFDVRVFRAIWCRIRQYWDGPKWVRVTDDERNLKWVGVNVPREQIQQFQQQNPQMAQQIKASVSNVAELDCDITIDDAPDSVTPALEQWQALVELKKVDANGELPFRVLIEAAPNLKNKTKILEMMDQTHQPDPMQEQAKQIALAGEAAKVEETQSKTLKNIADAHASQQPDAQSAAPPPKGPSESISYGDLPPDAQAQMLAQAGIHIHPAILAAHANNQARQQTDQAAKLAMIKGQQTNSQDSRRRA